MKKLKSMLHSAYCRYCVTAALACCMLAGAALASGGETSSNISAVQTAFTTGFTTIVSDASSMIVAIVPVALGLAGLIFVVKRAISWFKSIAK